MNIKQPSINSSMPQPPTLAKMIGPSLIILGMGLGSGEIILWPYLTANFGLGIIWAALAGIIFQFFINMEIERYSLVRGESIFVGFARLWRWAPGWFIFTTFIAWAWPGIIATSSKIFSHLFGFENFSYVAISLLILIGAILSLGKKLYKTVETFQKIIITIGVPAIILLVLVVADSADIGKLINGFAGYGDGYRFIPFGKEGFSLLVFIGALAYSGAGGNLNLAQSLYIKEKGYGMCSGTKGISGVLTNNEKVDIEGRTFELNSVNVGIFKKWWQLINLEHFLVFLLTGGITIIMLALLAYSSTKLFASTGSGIDFIFTESRAISFITSDIFAKIFLGVCGLMLFATQLTVLDSTSRIISENILLMYPKYNLSRIYYFVLWTQIIFGICVFLFGFNDPIILVTTGAVINALAMFFHIAATTILNRRTLDKKLWPSTLRISIISISWILFGLLLAYTIFDTISKWF